jgi:hypothetical protein
MPTMPSWARLSGRLYRNGDALPRQTSWNGEGERLRFSLLTLVVR